MTTTRKLAVLAAGIAAAIALAACQPPPQYGHTTPPADAVVVNVTTGDAILVRWSAGGLVCTGTLTVAEPGGPIVYTAGGMAATGTVFLTPAHDGRLAVWVRSSSPRCATSLDVVPNLSR